MSTSTSTAGSPPPNPSIKTIQRLARDDPLAHPLAFAVRHRDVFGHEQYPPPHLQDIYQDVFEAFDPTISDAPKALGYIYPRGHGKSETGSAIVPVWKVLRDPNYRVLIMMLNADEAKGKLEKCAGYLKKLAPLYGHEVIEDNSERITLARDADHAEPTIRAAGFKTGVTGGRYDVILFDDIVDRKAQRTEHRRETVREDFEDHLNLRAGDHTVFITLGTRKHPKDIYSNLINGGGWATRVRQAIADWSIVENGEYNLITTSQRDGLNRRYAANRIGEMNPQAETIVAAEPLRWCEVLWPDRRPLDNLLVDLHQGFGARKGSRVWRRENQNDARALQGQVLSEDMLTWVPTLPGRQSAYVRFAGLDLGVEKDPEKAAAGDTDYWALSIVAHHVTSGQTYLQDIYRERGMSVEQAISWVAHKLTPYDRLSKCLVEANQAQDFFVQRARNAGLPVEGTASSGAKEDRIIAMSALMESGEVKLVGAENPVERSAMMGNFVDEWTAFPNGDHDDLPDSTDIALRGLTPDQNQNETRVYDIGF